MTLCHRNPEPRPPARVVVIGVGGFVGGAIMRVLAEARVPILGLTRKEIDLADADAAARLAEALRPEDSVVFVAAAAPARTPELLIRNVAMGNAIAVALAAKPVAHVVYISSDAVYADDANPVSETSPCQPSSLHGMMHATRELVLKSQVKAPLAILRPSLLYGADDPHNGYGPNRFRRQAEKGEPIALFGDGEERRDHVYIGDLARLVALVLVHGSDGVLNVATGVSVSFRAVAEQVAALHMPPARIESRPRQGAVTHRHFDITACLKVFPRFTYTALDAGLKRAKSRQP